MDVVRGGVCWERRCHSDRTLCDGGVDLKEREMEDVMYLRWMLSLQGRRMRSLHLCDLIFPGRSW